MDTDLIKIMSNEALRGFAKFATDMRDIAPRYRSAAILARRELDRRDMVDAFGQEYPL